MGLKKLFKINYFDLEREEIRISNIKVLDILIIF